MKCAGGLTQGRGITDSTVARWIMATPSAMNISEQLERFCDVSFVTSEQHADKHVDARVSRITTDNSDVQKFQDWFSFHDPFPEEIRIKSISTGLIGEEKLITCHLAYEKGIQSIPKIVGSNFSSVKFSRKERVIPLQGIYSKIKIYGEQVPLPPDTIFRRIYFLKESKEEMKSYFEFELAPYPLSMFEETGMSKTKKLVVYDLFSPTTEQVNLQDAVYVVDGGYLLHRVTWQSKVKFSSILQKYVDYVKDYYKQSATIVFDGYDIDGSALGTKLCGRLRRAKN
jgi:hypothetical protein